MIEVVAIVVTYNGMRNQWLPNLMKSFEASSFHINVEVIDNASVDKTASFVQGFQFVEFTQLDKNHGFAHANNVVISKYLNEEVKYFLLLNQDVTFPAHMVKEMIREIEKSDEYHIISPIHYNGVIGELDNNFEVLVKKNDLTGGRLWQAMNSQSFNDLYPVSFVNAACWLVRKSCFEQIGLFDEESFPHYGEDDDFIYRVRKTGGRIGIFTGTFIHHNRAQGREREGMKLFPGARLSSYYVRQKHETFQNRLRFFMRIIRDCISLISRLKFKQTFELLEFLKDVVKLEIAYQINLKNHNSSLRKSSDD